MSKRESVLLTIFFTIIFTITIFATKDLVFIDNKEKIDPVEVEKVMFELVNNYRVANNSPPLVYAPWLEKGAQIRASEMAEYGSLRYVDRNGIEKTHTRPDGSSWETVFSEIVSIEGEDRFLSENIVLVIVSRKEDADDLAHEMFTEWKNSPEHNAAMLDENNKAFVFKFAQIPRYVKSEELIPWHDTYIGVQNFDTYSHNNIGDSNSE